MHIYSKSKSVGDRRVTASSNYKILKRINFYVLTGEFDETIELVRNFN